VYISSSDKIESCDNRSNDEYRSKVWLKCEEKKYYKCDKEEWNKSFWKVRKESSPFFQEICEKEYESELREFDRLYGWKSWYIDPSSSTIVLYTDKKY
jgi:hypothetical protein